MNRTFLFSLSSCTAFFVGLALYLGHSAGVSPPAWLPSPSEDEPPVMIFVVGTAERLARVRRRVDSDRVVVDAPRAFALREGRIIAAGLEDASLPLNAAGWRDREVELYQVAKRQRSGASRASAGGSRGSSAPAFSDLINKPELSRGEAMALLEAMDAGPAF